MLEIELLYSGEFSLVLGGKKMERKSQVHDSLIIVLPHRQIDKPKMIFVSIEPIILFKRTLNIRGLFLTFLSLVCFVIK